VSRTIQQKTAITVLENGHSELFNLKIINVLHVPLLKLVKLILPSLQNKLSLMKRFVKTVNMNNDGFLYLFPRIGEAMIKGAIFIGLQIRKVIVDSKSHARLNDLENAATNVTVIDKYVTQNTCSGVQHIFEDKV
jgi:hypothetical protein